MGKLAVIRTLGGLFACLAFVCSSTFPTADAQDLRPFRTISLYQEEVPILYASDFVIAEDGLIFVTDAKDCNIKSYDPTGRLIGVTGRRGPGPEEFSGPYLCDYQAPYLAILDPPRMKIIIYQRDGKGGLSRVDEIDCMACTSDIALWGKNVIVDAYVAQQNKKFGLTLRGFGTKSLNGLLSLERRYGFDSIGSYERNWEDLSMLTQQSGFLSVTGDYLYYILDARLKITRVNIVNQEIMTFGKPSASYREPRINQIIRNAFANKESAPVANERKKVSFITGIISANEMIGVLFSNYDATSDNWRLYMQRYDPKGELISEYHLCDAANYGQLYNYFFRDNILYVLSERYGDDSTDKYDILGYKIQ
jgi:hypothetical protein